MLLVFRFDVYALLMRPDNATVIQRKIHIFYLFCLAFNGLCFVSIITFSILELDIMVIQLFIILSNFLLFIVSMIISVILVIKLKQKNINDKKVRNINLH